MDSERSDSLSSLPEDFPEIPLEFEPEREPFLWDRDGPHPLCIPHIVDNILSYLDLPSLKLSRLINSQYNEIASTLLFQKEVIAFSKPSHLSSYLSTVAKVKDNTNEDDPSHSPRHHTRFHFNFDPDTLDPELSNFFTKLGPRVNSLHYTTDIILAAMPKELPHLGDIWALTPTLTHLQLEIKWGCPSVLFKEPLTLPSLRKLTLDLVLTEREVEAASSFLEQLLSSAPNLEEIEIPGSKKFFDDYTNVLLARLILRLPLKRLSRLNFCLALNPLQVLELGQKGLPLRTLILDFADVHHFSFPNQNLLLDHALHLLFSSCSSTLRNLHLCFPYNPNHHLHRFTFPDKMTSLSHLALGRFYGSVSILDSLPAIKKLDLWSVRFHDFHHGNEPDPNLVVPERFKLVTTVIS